MKLLKYKIIGITLFSFACFGCSTDHEPPELKAYIFTEYSTKTELNEIIKDEISVKYSIGNYPNGTQKYFVGLVGYTNNDTSMYDYKEYIPPVVKKIDNKTFYYDSSNELLKIEVKKNDTIFVYNDENDIFPNYYVFDKKERILVEVDGLMEIRKSYTQRKFNKYGALTYAVIQKDYLPSDSDKSYYNEIEIAKKQIESSETIILEVEYEYY